MDPGTRLLHVAPEPALKTAFLRNVDILYESIDLESSLADKRMDLTAMTFSDGIFDGILCIHVLEHVQEDGQALRELFRVLKPGGWSILQVPLNQALAVTVEGPDILDPQERTRLFGQPDHVRSYGRDYQPVEKVGASIQS